MSTPPKIANKILGFFLKEELLEEVLGDLEENFEQIAASKSNRKAKLNYWYQVLNYVRPFAIKRIRSNSITGTMFKHNFLISYRILLKNKFFSAINIGGLALGMTVAILIGLWIQDEFSFNKNHENYDRLVQVYRKDQDGPNTYINTSLVGQTGIYMQENYAHLFDKVAMTFFRTRPEQLSVGRQSYDKSGYYFQPDAPEMLTLKMVTGSREGLRDRSGILLSASLAKTFFGDENPIGETVNIGARTDLYVTGVYEDIPLNSTFSDANFIASLELIYNEKNPYSWDNYNIRVYAQLQEGVDINDASAAIKDIMMIRRDPEDGPIELFLKPMEDWHLNAQYRDGVQVTSKRKQMIWLNGLIGVFVLLLACINFMNLNTARYQNRAKEVGVRKAVGSLRTQLMNQFYIESFIYAFASFVISLLIAGLLLPWFNEISDKGLVMPWGNLYFWIIGTVFILFSSLIAGSYPAIFLSSFSPLNALKGTLKQGPKAIRFRQVLVVFQFTISIALIIGTISVYQQIQYAKTRPVGYNQEGLLTTRGRASEYFEKHEVLRQELKKTGMITEMAQANYPLMNTLGNNNGFKLEGSDERIPISFNTIFISHEYGKTTEWELVAGRDFSRDLADESGSIILSESAIERIGLEDPIGKRLVAPRPFNDRKEFTIIGVVKDMIKGSPYAPPRPLMVFATEAPQTFIFLRVNPEFTYLEALPKIQEVFEQVVPNNPFNYEFVGTEYLAKFRSEERVGSLATLFCVLAILISCLGLFGLSAFMVEQRTKEIGIRKVLGASVSTLWRLLSKDFTVLVLISCVLAVPLSSYFLVKWLAGFEYKMDLTWWVYAIAILAGFLVTIATVSFHSLKASMSNPVNSLRSE